MKLGRDHEYLESSSNVKLQRSDFSLSAQTKFVRLVRRLVIANVPLWYRPSQTVPKFFMRQMHDFPPDFPPMRLNA